MGSSSESSASPVPTSTFDERSLRQSLLFAGSLKDLRNLRSQLYSAARYFESSYSNDPLKQPPRDTLKQYVVGALVNTVDHLGSVSSKVSALIGEDIGTLSETERRVSCLEQRLRTCRALLDHEGLSRRSLPTDPQKCQKRYVLPGGESMAAGSGSLTMPGRLETKPKQHDGRELQPSREAALCSTHKSRTSSFRKIFSSSSFRWGRSSSPFLKVRPPSPIPPGMPLLSDCAALSTAPDPSPDLRLRSVSFSIRRTPLGSSNSWWRGREGPRKAAATSFHGGEGDWDKVEQSPNRSKQTLGALLGRRRWGKDAMIP